MRTKAKKKTNCVMCIYPKGDNLSVVKGKIYRVVDPEPNDRPRDIRIIDETGEDYLYDRSWFVEVQLSKAAVKALEAA